MVDIKKCKSSSDFLDKFADFVLSAGIALLPTVHLNKMEENQQKFTGSCPQYVSLLSVTYESSGE